MADSPPRRWLQFRLVTIFWLTLTIAIGIGAYRHGYEAGIDDAANQRSEVGSLVAKAYTVGDIVQLRKTNIGGVPDLEGLVRDLSTQVLPNTWTESGGNAAIVPFEIDESLVISHDQDGHERVAAYLKRLRVKRQRELLTSK